MAVSLPTQSSPFIGRTKELAEIAQLLADPLSGRELEVLHLVADGLSNAGLRKSCTSPSGRSRYTRATSTANSA